MITSGSLKRLTELYISGIIIMIMKRRGKIVARLIFITCNNQKVKSYLSVNHEKSTPENCCLSHMP